MTEKHIDIICMNWYAAEDNIIISSTPYNHKTVKGKQYIFIIV
jgi:hypothetical protein